MTTALERLTTEYYNSGVYNASTNPGGMGNGGHRLNLPLLLADVAEVAAVTNAAVLDAAQVTADKAAVHADRLAVDAVAPGVIAAMATYGFPARVQITNLNTLALGGLFYSTTTATGRPGGETDGFVYAISDGAADNGAQIFLSKNAAKTYTRYRTGGTWQSWVELTTAATVTDTAFGAENTIASAATCNIGSLASRLVEITGTTTITALGSSAVTTNPSFLVRFADVLTLTHHATALILPGGKSITTAALDHGLFQYLGAGNWRCIAYFRSSGEPLLTVGYGLEATIASAATVDLGTASALLVSITGTTPITAFGSSASTARPIYRIRFTGALTLTHNATTLILPGSANITTAAGDAAVMQYLGSGNWRCVSYHKANGKPLPAALADVATAKAGVAADVGVTPAGLSGAIQAGVMVYGGDGSATADVMEVTLVPAVAALVEGMTFLVKVQGENAGAATLNVNALGAVTIKRRGASLRGGELRDGQIYQFAYDGSFWQLISADDATLVTRSRFTVSGGAITSGSNAFFSLSRTGNGSFTITRTAAAPGEWGVDIFTGAAGSNLNLSANEKTQNSSTLTFEVRNGGNSLNDPSSLSITMWEKP